MPVYKKLATVENDNEDGLPLADQPEEETGLTQHSQSAEESDNLHGETTDIQGTKLCSRGAVGIIFGVVFVVVVVVALLGLPFVQSQEVDTQHTIVYTTSSSTVKDIETTPSPTPTPAMYPTPLVTDEKTSDGYHNYNKDDDYDDEEYYNDEDDDNHGEDDEEDDEDVDKSEILQVPGKMGYLEKPSCKVLSRSLIHSEECKHFGTSKPLPMFITGTGRSGTKFLYLALKKLGVRLSHEEVWGPLEDGAISWHQAFSNEPFMNHVANKMTSCKYHRTWGMNLHANHHFKHIFHLVREPLKVINSRFNNGHLSSIGFIHQTRCQCQYKEENMRPHSPYERKLALTMRHWVLWNSYVQHIAEWGFRAEDLFVPEKRAGIITELTNRSGITIPSRDAIISLNLAKSTNTHHTSKIDNLSWDYLYKLDPEFAIMAQLQGLRYGYTFKRKELVPELEAQYCDDQGCHADHVPELDCSFNQRNKWQCTLPGPFANLTFN